MKNKTVLVVSLFILGAITGWAITWFSCSGCSCCCGHSCSTAIDSSMVSRISPAQANQYANAYLAADTSKVSPLRAFAVNKAQLTAMQLISKDSTIHGFRVYMGLNEKGGPVRMVVGFGSPEDTENIYLTTADDSGPCPDFCDDKSDIMHR